MPARGYEFYLRYLTCSLRSLVRYRVEHEKIKFESTSGHVIFCLLYKHTNGDAFDNFSKISEQFPKIFEYCSKIVRRSDERVRTAPKIFEDNRRLPRKNRYCYDHTATKLRDYVTIAMRINSFVKIACYFHVRNNVLFLRVNICSRAKAHLVLHCCLCNKSESLTHLCPWGS